MSKLLNEFYLLLNRTIKSHVTSLINYNFNLANEYFYDEECYFSIYRKKPRKFLTKDFIEKYNKFKDKFTNYLFLFYSEEFLNLLEKYFDKLKNDILNYVKDKLFSINISYLNSDYYNKAFYFNQQINNEIIDIIDNINNYYNPIIINSDIKPKAVNLTEKILQPLHEIKMKYLDEYYNYLYSKTTHFHIKDGVGDFVYSYWQLLFIGWKDIHLYTDHTSNIHFVITDLKKTDEYLFKETDFIVKQFISKFDKYLDNYIIHCRQLHSHLERYLKNKIDNSYSKSKIKEYLDTYNKMKINYSNEKLLSKINEQSINVKMNIDIYISRLLNNIKLLRNKYYNLYYLQNNSKFMEYPEEIKYKINQFYDETIFNIDNIKLVVNSIYEKRIKYIIKSTNIYFNNFITNQINYIKVNINTSYIFKEYYLERYNELDKLHIDCISKNIFEFNNNNILFLNEENYDIKIK